MQEGRGRRTWSGEDGHQQEGALGTGWSSSSPRSPKSLQRGQGSEGVGGWWEHWGTELSIVRVPACNWCSVHIVYQIVSHLCLEPSMAPSSLWAKAKVLAVAPQGPGWSACSPSDLISSRFPPCLLHSSHIHPPGQLLLNVSDTFQLQYRCT